MIFALFLTFGDTNTLVVSRLVKQCMCMSVNTVKMSFSHILTDGVDIQKAPLVTHASLEKNYQVNIPTIVVLIRLCLVALLVTMILLASGRDVLIFPQCGIIKLHISYDVVPGSEITPCNKIDQPLVVYIFTINVMHP